MVLIGSHAIRHWFPDFPREPKDLDYAVDNKTSIVPSLTLKTEYLFNPIITYLYPDGFILPPDHLYTLKISHLFWDINWEKHMFDAQFLKKKGCTLSMCLFNNLYIQWNDIHGKNKRSDLKMSSEDFFNNMLKTYDHDVLHVLLNPIPTYTKVLREGAEVEVDENKFNQLSHDEKLELVREEIYVMSYERLGCRDYREAYGWMLKKFIISHAPIWEALWIIENYIELHKPIINYKKQLDYELSRNPEGIKRKD